MTALPEPLKPWAGVLQLFPDELAVGLGSWLPRLALAIGPLRARAEEGFDEPDGFDGLSRRGPYERLLPAEWALAQEFPEEFTRRAASGEHAFFRLAFRSPAGQRRCLALVDSGPSQLGTPRLAHLAALVVLERRAQEARAEFLWGVLQQPPGRCLTGISASSVEHWMQSRSALEPVATHYEGWQRFFGNEVPDDELWMIGGERVRKLSSASALVVHDSEEPSLRVDVRPRGSSARQVCLALPSDELCTRLIRDPLRREAASTHTTRPTSKLLFIASGSRLLYCTAPDQLMLHVIPGAPGVGGASQTVNLPKGEQLLAVGWDRGLVTVGQQGTAEHWNWYSKSALLRGQGAWHLHASNSHPAMGKPPDLGSCLASGWFVTARGDLVGVEDNRTYRVASLNVAAVAVGRQRLVAVIRGEDEARIDVYPSVPGATLAVAAPTPQVAQRGAVRVQLFPAAREKVMSFSLDGSVSENGGKFHVRGVGPRAPIVFGFDNLSPLGVLVALGLSDGRWRVVQLRPTPQVVDLVLPEGATVIGAAQTGAQDNDAPGVLAIEKDGRTVTLFLGKTQRRLVRASARIINSTVSHFSSHLSMETEDGQLSVYSLRREQMVLRLNTSGSPR